MTPRLWLVALLWILWCVLHSLLIARGVQRRVAGALGPRSRHMRLAYNSLAMITFAAVCGHALSFRGPIVFDWWGAWVPVGAVLLPASLALFWAGARVYDLRVFLGVGARDRSGIGAAGGLSHRGILGAIRHPWYTAGLFILWVPPMDPARLITAIILSLYLIVGAHLEERKLLAEFGEAYRAYRCEVSMFLPFRWVRARLFTRG